MLYGIEDFYHRFGYGVVFPVSRLVVKTEALLRADEQRVTYPQNSDAMGRIVHLRALMEKLVPELSKRSAGFRGRVSVAIETDIGTVGLGIDRKGVRVMRGGVLAVKMPQLMLTQLVMGYRSVADIACDPRVSVSKKAMPVLDRLFPKRDAYMWWSDRF